MPEPLRSSLDGGVCSIIVDKWDRAISVDKKARRGYNPIVLKRERKLELLLVAATGSAR